MVEDGAEELVRRFQAGDEHAFQTLFENNLDVVRGCVTRRLPARMRRRLSVSDVLQETQLIAFQRRESFEEQGPNAFRRWLCGIAENKLREAIRRHRGTAKRAADREVSRGGRPDTAQFRAQSPSPSQAASSNEARERLLDALARLPDDYREILVMTRVKGLTLREAAEGLGRSYEAGKKLYGRAFLRLREICSELEADDTA